MDTHDSHHVFVKLHHALSLHHGFTPDLSSLSLVLRSALRSTALVGFGFIFLLVAYVLHNYIIARKQFPGPRPSFWSGNLAETMADNVHENWRRWHREHGPVFQTWNSIFSRTIYVGDPALVARVARENWAKIPSQYSGFKPLSGNALFAQMHQERWRQQRKSLAPAFQPSTVDEQYPALAKYIHRYVDKVDDAAQRGATVDMSVEHVLLTLDFIGDIAFGHDFEALISGESCSILQMFQAILPELMKCGLFPLRAKIPILKSTRTMHKNIALLRQFGYNAVENARKNESAMGHDGQQPVKRIFEILATQRDEHGKFVFSDEELCDNYVTFLVAGGDPTAHTVTFAVNEILRHPEVLRKLREELDANIPDECVVPTPQQARSLTYLNMVIKETLRFNGPGFGTFRYTPVDQLVNGVSLPANTTLALWNPQVHRDPNVWGPDADSFNPDRWAGGKQPISGSYFPFSYGPRKCLGQGLAMLEMTLTLATLFKRYDLKFEDGFKLEYLASFTLCAKDGLKIVAKMRDGVPQQSD